MTARPASSRTLLLALAVGLLVALIAGAPRLWLAGPAPAPVPDRDLTPPRQPVPPRPPAPDTPVPAPACAARTSQACHDGDVWWLDSCGAPQELAASCEGRACSAARCAASRPSDARCAELSAYGVCEGDRALACIDRTLLSVDCAAKGQRCAMTREGARCLPHDLARGCGPRELASCVGDRLRQCVDGYWEELDCAARAASCISDGDGARCGPGPTAKLPPPLLELCNQRDDDGDGRSDEGGACEPIALVAFLPAAAQLQAPEERLAHELEIVNRVFAPLRFEWARTVEVDEAFRVIDPERLELAARTLARQQASASHARQSVGAAREAAREDAGLAFYIPVLLAEQVWSDPPKAGLATLPNAHCGGVRISDAPSPADGLIVLSDARAPETLSHELGHYLGLCHTHEELDRLAAAAPELPSCARTGDGICDTASDPGPSACYERAACDYFCPARSERPDSSNLMSYYMSCRRAFTPEQLREINRVLQLRRGWFRCLDRRDCPCEPAVAAACPLDMSCQPGGPGEGWSCELDGPSLPGTACRYANQCAQGAVCIASASAAAGSCIRPCLEGADCRCTDVGLPFQVCAEDLTAPP